jgi:hypothetical protein
LAPHEYVFGLFDGRLAGQAGVEPFYQRVPGARRARRATDLGMFQLGLHRLGGEPGGLGGRQQYEDRD